MDEIVPELGGLLQRRVALGQGPLDVHVVGDVGEGHQRRAVGQRHQGRVEHRSVGAGQRAAWSSPPRSRTPTMAARTRAQTASSGARWRQS